jgi:hypothetical protein
MIDLENYSEPRRLPIEIMENVRSAMARFQVVEERLIR